MHVMQASHLFIYSLVSPAAVCFHTDYYPVFDLIQFPVHFRQLELKIIDLH